MLSCSILFVKYKLQQNKVGRVRRVTYLKSSVNEVLSDANETDEMTAVN